jgi:hypothetical protein
VVSAICWNEHNMQVQLPSLGNDFSIKGLNKGNSTNLTATSESFSIKPGTYLLTAKDKNPAISRTTNLMLPLDGFAAPENTNHDIYVNTAGPEGIPAGKPFSLQATALIPAGSKLTLLLSRPGWGRPAEVPMTENSPGNFSGMVPAEMAIPGILQYRIRVQHGEEYTTFPRAVKGNPMGWDYVAGESREITVLPSGSDLLLFNANTDRTPTLLPSWGRGIQQGIVPAQTGGGFAFQFQSNQWGKENLAALQYAVPTKLQPFENEANGYTHVVVKARALNKETQKIRIILVTKDAIAWSARGELSTQTSEIILPLGAFNPSRYLLLPRPYPGFHPLWFTGSGNAGLFRLKDIDLLQLMVEKEDNPGLKDTGPGFEIEWIGLRK